MAEPRAARDRRPMGWRCRAGPGRAAAAGAGLGGGVAVRDRGWRSGSPLRGTGSAPGRPRLAERPLPRVEEGRAVSVRRSLSWCPSSCGGNWSRVGEARGDGAGTLPVCGPPRLPSSFLLLRELHSRLLVGRGAAWRGAWEPRPLASLPPGCVLRMAMGSPGALSA